MIEQPLSFLSGGQWLSGIIHQPDSHYHQQTTNGVLIVVGGPQTRVGSHRQFLLLARFLARQGYFVMRFDYHGMGDSEGDGGTFLNASGDINMAVDQFIKHCPSLSSISLWGLCDAASAILLFNAQHPREDVSRFILLNPWVTTEHLKAKTALRHYYLSKFTDKQFWSKLVRFELGITQALKEVIGNIKTARSKPKDILCDEETEQPNQHNYVGLMRQSLAKFSGETHIILSGDDMVAAEFNQLIADDNKWQEIINDERVSHSTIEEANHTFASQQWREIVEKITLRELSKN